MGKSSLKDDKSRNMGIDSSFVACELALKRYLARYLNRREDIDDMAQETYLRAYKATEKRWIEFPKAYLFKVARTVALGELSKKMRQLTDYLEEMPAEEPSSEGAIDEELIAEQRVTLYCDAIAELPPQCRRVFLMRKVHGLSHKEISAELGITTSAVERNITRGVFQFKRYVDGKESGGDSSGKSGGKSGRDSGEIQALTGAVPHSAKDPGGL